MSGNVKTLNHGHLFSINALANETGKHWNQVKRALRDIPADGELNGKAAWYLSTALPPLAALMNSDSGNGIATALEDMSAKDRFDYIRSERELIGLQKDTQTLAPESEVRQEFAILVHSFIKALDTLPDILEREANLSPKQAELMQRICDATREKLYQKHTADDDDE